MLFRIRLGTPSLAQIWHERSHGFHGWSIDGGTTWQSNSKSRGTAFFEDQSAVAKAGKNKGSDETVHFARRERPELLFDVKSGLPTHLITGVQAQGAGGLSGTAYSHIQRVRT